MCLKTLGVKSSKSFGGGGTGAVSWSGTDEVQCCRLGVLTPAGAGLRARVCFLLVGLLGLLVVGLLILLLVLRAWMLQGEFWGAGVLLDSFSVERCAGRGRVTQAR